MQLSLDYDERSDVLYASFGPARPAIGDALDGDDSVILRYEECSGRMVGFTLIGIARGGPAGLQVPLIRGDVRCEDQGIRRDTPWLELRMMPRHADLARS